MSEEKETTINAEQTAAKGELSDNEWIAPPAAPSRIK